MNGIPSGLLANFMTKGLFGIAEPIRRVLSMNHAIETDDQISKIVRKAVRDVEGSLARRAKLTGNIDRFLKALSSSGLTTHLCEVAIMYPPIMEETRRGYQPEERFLHNNRIGLKEAFCLLYQQYTSKRKSEASYFYDMFMRGLARSFANRRDEVEVYEFRKQRTNAEIFKRLDVIDRSIAGLYDQERRKKSEQVPFPPKVDIEALEAWIKRVAEATVLQCDRLPVYGPNNRKKEVEIKRVFAPCHLVSEGREKTDGQLAPEVFLARIHRAVVLGDPGGGKTTLTRWFSLSLAEEAITDSGALPILTEARRFHTAVTSSPDLSLLSHIVNELSALTNDTPKDTKNLLLNLLGIGRAFLIFDGLDEITDIETRRTYGDGITNLTRSFPLCRVLVTSRRYGYAQSPLGLFNSFGLSGLDHKGSSELFTKLSTELWDFSDDKAEEKAKDFMRQVGGNSEDLISNPLMLGLMCWLYHEQRGDLPATRARLYRSCADLMFEEWDRQRGIEAKLPEGFNVFALLEDIAPSLYSNPEFSDGIPKTRLLKIMEAHFQSTYYSGDKNVRARNDAKTVTEFVTGRAWILTDKGPDVYAFTHRTFLEYFFALSLHEKNKGLDDLFETLEPQIKDGSWGVPAGLALQERLESFRTDAEPIAEWLIDLAGRTKPDSSDAAEVSLFLVEMLGSLSGATEKTIVRLVKAICQINKTAGSVQQILNSPNRRRSAVLSGLSEFIVPQFTRSGSLTGPYADRLKLLRYAGLHKDFFDVLFQCLSEEDEKTDRAKNDAALAKIRLDLFGTHIVGAARKGAEVWNDSVTRLHQIQWIFFDLALILRSLKAVHLEGESAQDHPMAEFGIRIAREELTSGKERILPLSILPGESSRWAISDIHLFDKSFDITELMDKGGVDVVRTVVFVLQAINKIGALSISLLHSQEQLKLAIAHFTEHLQDELLQQALGDRNAYHVPVIKSHYVDKVSIYTVQT